jgi:alanine-alpha-ketoisovalerate/valine-pyruvate aminotransferase
MNTKNLISYYVEQRLFNDNFTLFEMVNDLTIINQSATNTLTINNVVLVPGQQFNTGGNFGEYNHQQYNCHFSATDTANNQALVLLKRYNQLLKQ